MLNADPVRAGDGGGHKIRSANSIEFMCSHVSAV
jgi:hypothetical protein